MLWLPLSILSWIVTLLSANSAPVFQVHPISINTTEGSVVEFTCTANNTLILNFIVNEGAVYPSKGFEQIDIPPNGGNVSRVLLVTASVADNDNSTIRCQAVGTGDPPPVFLSDTAILRVQGPLSSVVDLSYSFITCYSVNISWSPPFTLPGTDITGYNISATSNGTTTNCFTSNSYYELSLTDPFNEIMVNISGYNGLDGEAITLNAIIPPARNLSLSLDVIIDHTLNIFLNFTAVTTSNICPYEYPTSLEYRLFLGDHLIINNTLSYADVVDIGYPLNITNNEVYTIIVSFTNDLAPELYQYDIINTTFDTYDLVSVCVLNSSDSRVCLECSFSSFSTDNAGCTVELVSSTSSTLTYNETFSKPNPNSDDVEGCIDGINTGQYSITVYGGNRPPVLIPELTITGTLIPMENITTFTTTTTSVTDNMSPTLSMDTEANNSSGRSSITIIIITIIAVVIVLVFITLIVNIVLVIIDRKKNKKSIILHHPNKTEMINQNQENIELKTINTDSNEKSLIPKDETPPPPIPELEQDDEKHEIPSDYFVIGDPTSDVSFSEQPPPHYTVQSLVYAEVPKDPRLIQRKKPTQAPPHLNPQQYASLHHQDQRPSHREQPQVQYSALGPQSEATPTQ